MAGPNTERIIPAAPISTAAGRVIVSPFQFVLTGEDNLRVTSWSSFDGATITIQGRIMDAKGNVKSLAFAHVPRSDLTAKSDNFPLGIGAMLNLTAFVSNGFAQFGRIFVRVEIIRGFQGGTMVLGTLLQGYITEQERLAWPGSPLQSSLDGPGYVHVNVDPAGAGIGQDFTITIGATTRLEYFSIAALLTTSAAAGTRTVSLDLYNGANFVARCPNPGSQGPSQARFWVWAQGLAYETAVSANTGVGGLPLHMPLPFGYSWKSSTVSLAAGDQWSTITTHVREHLSIAF